MLHVGTDEGALKGCDDGIDDRRVDVLSEGDINGADLGMTTGTNLDLLMT